MSNYIRLAIQKKGRLSEDSLKLIRECGIKFYNGSGKLKAKSGNFPIEFLFLRDDDIPDYVADGVADIGIVGENTVIEKGKAVETVKQLGFSKCRLSLAIKNTIQYEGIPFFQNKGIATSYPNILKNFLDRNDLRSEIHEISGSVEIAPGIGLADAVFDIVSSGSTLLSNGLKEVETIMESQAVLISTPELDKTKTSILNKLLFRMESVQNGANNKYILLNAPNDRLDDIISLLPGMRSPTVLPLVEEGWSSLHSVINEDEFWENIEQLRAAGAEGILVVPIEKMVL